MTLDHDFLHFKEQLREGKKNGAVIVQLTTHLE
jgi:hypothetical protein